MFDIGLSELMFIAVVALVVIGPERLPKVARTAGHILGRLQRYVSDVKADINREMQLDELKTLQKQMTDQVNSISSSVSHEMREVESSVGKAVEPVLVDSVLSPGGTSIEMSPDDLPQSVTSEATSGEASQPAPAPESKQKGRAKKVRVKKGPEL